MPYWLVFQIRGPMEKEIRRRICFIFLMKEILLNYFGILIYKLQLLLLLVLFKQPFLSNANSNLSSN